MKKLISAATSLVMAATMVAAALPVAVSAADTTKGFSIKTYDIKNPSADAGKSTITINQADIPAEGYVIPSALYYSEGTVNSTDSLLVSLTTDSKDISFKYYDPGKDSYTATAESYNLGGVDFTTDRYISWAGFCKSARSGYKPAGEYVFGLDSSQSAAGTDNYFLGCSWMNKGVDYAWAGEKSDSYPFYVFETIIPQNIKPGTYKVTYCDYNTDASGVNDNPCPMVEGGGSRYTIKGANGDQKLSLEEMTIVVKGDGDTPTPTTTTVTTAPPTVTTTTTVAPSTPTVTDVALDGDVNFEFVDTDGNNVVKIPSGQGKSIDVDVNINAGTNPISALDVQFKTSSGISITEIVDSANAFPGVTVSTNLDELRANYATLKGDTPMNAVNGASAFMLTVNVPAGTPDGTYTVGFDSQCKIFKDNTKFNYKTAAKPLTIIVGEGGEVKDTQTTTVTTTKAPTVTTTVAPSNAAVKFTFADTQGNSKINVEQGKATSIDVDVNIDAGTNPISALDVQFKASNGIKIKEIIDSANAFPGVTVSTNLDELRANYATLKGDTPMNAVNGSSAFMLTVEVPANTPAGTYTVGFDSQCKIFKDNTKFNYETSATPLTIVVGDPGEVITTPTTTEEPTVITTTSTAPVVQGDVNFAFVDTNGKDSINITDTSKATSIDLDVNIEAGTNPISALDVQFKVSQGLKVTEIVDSANAFPGVTVSTNLDELRANYATLKGDTPMNAVNGSSAFMLTVEVPAGTPAGTYTVGFDSQCKIFKDNTKFNYSTSFKPFTIVVGEVTTTPTTTSVTTTTKETTTVTTVTTTDTPVEPGAKLNVTLWGDVNCNGEVNVADIVVLNRLLNDPSYVVKNPDTKADVTLQGKVNGDVVAPQSKDGKNIDPTSVKLTAADSEAIAMFILYGQEKALPID